MPICSAFSLTTIKIYKGYLDAFIPETKGDTEFSGKAMSRLHINFLKGLPHLLLKNIEHPGRTNSLLLPPYADSPFFIWIQSVFHLICKYSPPFRQSNYKSYERLKFQILKRIFLMSSFIETHTKINNFYFLYAKK